VLEREPRITSIAVILAVSSLFLMTSPSSLAYGLRNGTFLSFSDGLALRPQNADPVGYWTNATPSWGPGSNVEAAMTYVPELKGTLLFGGGRFGGGRNETWLYNLTRNNWTRLAPASIAPPMWVGMRMVHDPDASKVVLFGGIRIFENHCVSATNETWVYDPSSNEWANVTPPHSPPLRTDHAMAYDPFTHQVVLFGGLDFFCGFRVPEYSGPRLNDTWLYDVRANLWTNITKPAAPPARSGAGISYDPNVAAIVLFGGAPVSQGYPGSWSLGDTWSLDVRTGAWNDVRPASFPTARSGPGMAYDPAAESTVMYGGCGSGLCDRDTWWYDGETRSWKRMPSAEAPDFPNVFGHGGPSATFAYDPGGVLVAHGRGETWEYRVSRAIEPLVVWASAVVADVEHPLTVSFTSDVTGGAAPYRYAWSFGDGVTSAEANPVHTYGGPGQYPVTVVVTVAAGASATSTRDVSVAGLTTRGEWIPYAVAGAVATIVIGIGVWWWMGPHRAHIRKP
jgi:hypothetical protein